MHRLGGHRGACAAVSRPHPPSSKRWVLVPPASLCRAHPCGRSGWVPPLQGAADDHYLDEEDICFQGSATDEPSPEAVQEAGRRALQRLAVERLTTRRYSVTHALLATIPHSATVTTNSDLCYDAACKAANIEVVVLPYETRVPGSDAPGRWLLKLHGDVHHPEDIILTYSSSTPYATERLMPLATWHTLLTLLALVATWQVRHRARGPLWHCPGAAHHEAHALCVRPRRLQPSTSRLRHHRSSCGVRANVSRGFSLTDDAFNQIAATVRRAIDPTANGSQPFGAAGRRAEGEPRPDDPTTVAEVVEPWATQFGTTLTLSDRPFMAELWPELDAVPMGDGLTDDTRDRAARQRCLEVLLDRVSLLASDSSTHLLDPTFAGTFTSADVELKREIDDLLAELRDDPEACRSEAFEEVRDMFVQLGLPSHMLPADGQPRVQEPVAEAWTVVDGEYNV